MTEEQQTEVTRRVQIGIAFLNRFYEDDAWESRVNVDRLDMHNGIRGCLLCQVTAHTFLEALVSVFHLPLAQASTYGFYVDFADEYGITYAMLTEGWKTALEARRTEVITNIGGYRNEHF